jgi:hypothetical protein
MEKRNKASLKIIVSRENQYDLPPTREENEKPYQSSQHVRAR